MTRSPAWTCSQPGPTGARYEPQKAGAKTPQCRAISPRCCKGAKKAPSVIVTEPLSGALSHATLCQARWRWRWRFEEGGGRRIVLTPLSPRLKAVKDSSKYLSPPPPALDRPGHAPASRIRARAHPTSTSGSGEIEVPRKSPSARQRMTGHNPPVRRVLHV